jgi:CheY-like chemotaxis protein
MPTILVVDDCTELRDAVSIILKLEGYRVLTAANGKEAVYKVWQYLPDLIVCDVQMPELNGFEVLSILRSASQTEHTPFIFLTAEDSLEVSLATQFHFDGYLCKPFAIPQLLETIRHLLTARV